MGQTPIHFCCPVCRQATGRKRKMHPRQTNYTLVHSTWAATGRIKKRPQSRAHGGFRSVPVLVEYRCSRGHVGWTTHCQAFRKWMTLKGREGYVFTVARAVAQELEVSS
jgi:hypothetical protein